MFSHIRDALVMASLHNNRAFTRHYPSLCLPHFSVTFSHLFPLLKLSYTIICTHWSPFLNLISLCYPLHDFPSSAFTEGTLGCFCLSSCFKWSAQCMPLNTWVHGALSWRPLPSVFILTSATTCFPHRLGDTLLDILPMMWLLVVIWKLASPHMFFSLFTIRMSSYVWLMVRRKREYTKRWWLDHTAPELVLLLVSTSPGSCPSAPWKAMQTCQDLANIDCCLDSGHFSQQDHRKSSKTQLLANPIVAQSAAFSSRVPVCSSGQYAFTKSLSFLSVSAALKSKDSLLCWSCYRFWGSQILVFQSKDLV